jgi:hypothetical protein
MRTSKADDKTMSATVALSDAIFFDETALAQRWGCSKQKIEMLRYQGRGPRFHKLGRSVRYRLVDVIEFENASIVETSDSSKAVAS